MFSRRLKLRLSFVILILFFVFFIFNLLDPAVIQAKPLKKADRLQGAIRVSGAWALYPMMVKWAEEFKKIHPEVRIDVSAGGAGKGIADALSGFVDIGMVSRELRPEEIKKKAFFVPVAKDAVYPTVNANNPVVTELMQKGVMKKTFLDLWITGRPMTWGDLSGTKNNQKIRLYTRSDSCGAAETWAKYLDANQEDLKGVGVYGDPGLAEAVRKDKTGIGYNNLNYVFDIKTGAPLTGLLVVPIDVNENGRVDSQEKLRTKQEAIQAVVSGAYPSPPARDLYLVTKGAFRDPANVFVRWILTEGQKYIDESGYLKISKAQIKSALEKTEQ